MERFVEERFSILRHLFRGAEDLARHHHDSYDRFIQSQLPLLIREISPIKIPLVQKDRVELLERGKNPELDDGGLDDSHQATAAAGGAAAAAPAASSTGSSIEDQQDADVYGGFDAVVTIDIGGEDGTGIRIRKPVIYEENERGEHIPTPMYPNEARLRGLTYSSPVTVDIRIRVLNLRTMEAREDIMADVPLFNIPVLVKSKSCWLYSMTSDALTEVGEDPDDPGGYFIVGGAERLLVSQERVIPNMPYITSIPEVMMACSASGSTKVKVTRVSFDKKTRGIVASIPGVKGKIPVAILFRALGIISDLDIVRHIFGSTIPDEQESDVIRDTLASAHGIYDQHSAMRLLVHLSRGLTMMSARTIIHQQIFPQQTGGLPEKAALLGYMVRLLVHRHLGRIGDTDRDNFRSKKLAITGSLIAELLANVFQTREEEIRKRISSEYNYNNSSYRDGKVFQLLPTIQMRRDAIFGAIENTSLVLRSLRGQWGADPARGIKAQIEGVSQAMDRLTYLATLSHLRRVTLERVPEGRALGARRQHMSSFGYICPSETPSGGPKIGVVKNLAILARISAGVTSSRVLELLRELGVVPVHDVPADKRAVAYSVFLNGVLAGYCPSGLVVRDELLSRRRRGLIHPTVSISLMRIEKYLWISTEAGRLMRPLIRVRDGVPMVREAVAQLRRAIEAGNDATAAFSLTPFVTREPDSPVRTSAGTDSEEEEAALELIDPWEMETLYVAMSPEQVGRDHTHLEIHPSTLFGVMGIMIPYAPHNQGPRNLYSCAQSKQGTSVYSKAFRSRYDHSSMVLMSPQRPIANTWWGRRLGDSALAYGVNLVVAIACFSGYNQEDGVLVNKTSLERGLFRVTKSTETSSREEYDDRTKTRVRIIDPRVVQGVRGKRSSADYGFLLEDGTLPEGTPIHPGMVIFGRISEKEGELPRDVSVVAGRFAKGVIESKVVLRLANGHRMVRYKISVLRSPELGDKFSSRAGQKGTCGMLIPEVDMPRTIDGIVPDLIVNPHAIPSRMTIGQIQEVVVSKLGSLLGCEVDATAFTQNGVFGENIANLLLANGYDPRGDEMMYSGVTGEVLHTKIFIGPTYYMRLKHMAADKINYRGGGLVDRGPVDARTRQPIGGRAREGGLRIGEMERDSVISHGASRFLQESLTVRADGETSLVCAESGKQAFRGDGKHVYPGLRSVERDGPFQYRGNTENTLENITHTTKSTRFSEVSFPRGLRVLTQEMETMGIDTRIFTDGGAARLRPDTLGEKPALPEEELTRETVPQTGGRRNSVPEETSLEPASPFPVPSNPRQSTFDFTKDEPEPDDSLSLANALVEYTERQEAARRSLLDSFVGASAGGGFGESAEEAAKMVEGRRLNKDLLQALVSAQTPENTMKYTEEDISTPESRPSSGQLTSNSTKKPNPSTSEEKEVFVVVKDTE